ncbi:MAG: hypothetical protein WC147_08625 [Syntrophomonas sp.]
MQEQDRLLMKKHELEQLIMDNQELYVQSGQGNGMLSSYASHPADLASHLQVLNIELERINEALAQDNPEQLS